MKLIGAHKSLVALAMLLSVGLIVRDVATRDARAPVVLRVAASAALAAALGFYLRWFVRHAERTMRGAEARGRSAGDKEMQPSSPSERGRS